MKLQQNHSQKITPFLWFNGQAEEAMHFYTSIFKNSTIDEVYRYGENDPGVQGSVMSVSFHIEGQKFMAINGGPDFNFSPAISFFVQCDTQEEVDELWKKLSAGGKPNRCGWLTDKYGISWQIIPSALGKLLYQTDAEKSNRVRNAMLQMNKIEIAILEQAAAG